MFKNAKRFSSNLGRWTTPSAQKMASMFEGAARFDGDVSTFDVSQITDFSNVFKNAAMFNGNLRDWNVSSALTTASMFEGAQRFNGDLSQWNVTKNRNFVHMFKEAKRFAADLSKWRTISAQQVQGMFDGASSFFSDISKWSVGQVKDASRMFTAAVRFNIDLSLWDVSNFKNMTGMFDRTKDLWKCSLASMYRVWPQKFKSGPGSVHGWNQYYKEWERYLKDIECFQRICTNGTVTTAGNSCAEPAIVAAVQTKSLQVMLRKLNPQLSKCVATDDATVSVKPGAKYILEWSKLWVGADPSWVQAGNRKAENKQECAAKPEECQWRIPLSFDATNMTDGTEATATLEFTGNSGGVQAKSGRIEITGSVEATPSLVYSSIDIPHQVTSGDLAIITITAKDVDNLPITKANGRFFVLHVKRRGEEVVKSYESALKNSTFQISVPTTAALGAYEVWVGKVFGYAVKDKLPKMSLPTEAHTHNFTVVSENVCSYIVNRTIEQVGNSRGIMNGTVNVSFRLKENSPITVNSAVVNVKSSPKTLKSGTATARGRQYTFDSVELPFLGDFVAELWVNGQTCDLNNERLRVSDCEDGYDKKDTACIKQVGSKCRPPQIDQTDTIGATGSELTVQVNGVDEKPTIALIPDGTKTIDLASKAGSKDWIGAYSVYLLVAGSCNISRVQSRARLNATSRFSVLLAFASMRQVTVRKPAHAEQLVRRPKAKQVALQTPY